MLVHCVCLEYLVNGEIVALRRLAEDRRRRRRRRRRRKGLFKADAVNEEDSVHDRLLA